MRRVYVAALREAFPLTRVPEQNYVAILDDVLFAFEFQLGFFFGRGETAGFDQIFPVHHFGFDEAALDIAVNGAGGFLRGSCRDRWSRRDIRVRRR